MDRNKKVSFLLMLLLVTIWGFDYTVAKGALEVFKPLNLMFFKYAGGLIVVFVLKLLFDRKFTVRKRDIPVFILCSLTGHLFYYFCEYTAMEYIQVSLITIILAFMPIASIITERVLYKRRFSLRLAAGMLVCLFGITLVIGADFRVLLQGKFIGYVLAAGAMLSWNAYNFITAGISQHYSLFSMSFNQLICTVLLSLPYALSVMPPASEFTPKIIASIVYLGVISAGVGYLLCVRGLRELGPTITALFTNFMPVTSTFFAFLLLNQSLSRLQVVGGIVVMAASCFVILEKEKQNSQLEAEKSAAGIGKEKKKPAEARINAAAKQHMKPHAAKGGR